MTCNRSQDAGNKRGRARGRIFALQVPENNSDAVPYERLL